MKRYAALTLAFVLATSPAAAERLITSLSSHQVLVSSSFTGTELVLFGAIERDSATVSRKGGYDIIVTVSGPREALVVRRKDRVVGIWTNAESNTFLDAPTYLAVLSNKPLDEIAPAEMLRRLDIGMNVVPRMHVAAGIESGEETFRDALIRLRKERHLYIEDPAGVTFITPTLFRATIRLPAESPVGIYDVDVRLFADNTNLARASSALEVVKVGIEQFIVTAARDHGILYGLFTTLMALMTGWFASIVFRRD
ncbi:TIGR02186 family protein [Pseudorhodoplanes sinuspersici]|uniref:Uncharacterized protein n=1 Tax=Pseudorhodoplanes sinuspersici TaxID=1235591 RepID=A0A1W6ZMJ9_9HYPH|nr:TIGR02186 family protein [Pseudorhodoplanes sinuspersici]ARP98616.1 hypothetical protein CAK95_05620 [Pseudorhodoplanes sinuspersici]RKE69801.1 uncharacterized protein (TIGR02186 family) [Pseudorhodoplanes sinuspersici]